VKYDSSGNVVWANKAGGNYEDVGNSIAVDGSGNCYITGYFSSTSTFGSLTLICQSTVYYDVFVVKYDSSGNVVWAKNAGDAITYEAGNSITIDDIGNSYVTGSFMGSITLGSFTLTNKGSSDIFIVKYDDSGKCGVGQRCWWKRY
jgi:hypothetical protein